MTVEFDPATDAREGEANAFAMELLMPAEFLRADLRANPIDLANPDDLQKLAKKYRVDPTLMAIRIGQLMSER